jgi:hypothetical protein
MTAAHESVLVDLVEIRSVCAAVVAWFDSYTAGTPSPIDELDRAVTRAKTLPHLAGALGRAVATIASGGRGATRDDIVGVVDQLRRAASVPNVDLRLRPSRPWRSSRRRQLSRTTTAGQLTLRLPRPQHRDPLLHGLLSPGPVAGDARPIQPPSQPHTGVGQVGPEYQRRR